MVGTLTPTDSRPRTPRGPRLPEIPGPGETLLRTWRGLRRMSTALKLLFALAAAAVLATFVPQEPVIPTTVADWRVGVDGPGELAAGVLDTLGLFDVFGSWWFTALTGLLIVSLTGCLIPRIGGFVRVARRPPVAGRNLTRLTHHAEIASPLPPAEALAAAESLLASRRFRRRHLAASETPGGVAQLAAERGHWREGGSLAFHLSFYVLLAGAVIGHTFGFVGQVNIVEGGSFADTRIAYDAFEPGRLFPFDGHRGFEVELDDFDVSYFDAPGSDASAGPVALTPREFVSRVTIRDGDVAATEEIRVNEPVSYDGVKLYQIRFGFAPRIEVRNSSGAVLYTEEVILVEGGGFTWSGVAPVAKTDTEQQLALELILLPDAGFSSEGFPISRTPDARNPRMAVVVWFGDLGLERNVPTSQFDREAGNQLPQPLILAPGETGVVDQLGLEVTFADLPYWSGFQVAQEPGRGLLLTGAGLLLGGLIPSLYSYRRRIWVETHPDGDGSRVVLAGVALQRKQAFTEAFASLESHLRRRLDPPVLPTEQRG